jgi:hypothetical protein
MAALQGNIHVLRNHKRGGVGGVRGLGIRKWQSLITFITENDHKPHCLGMSYYVNFLGGLGSNEFHIK